jgi:hypothetical protein
LELNQGDPPLFGLKTMVAHNKFEAEGEKSYLIDTTII